MSTTPVPPAADPTPESTAPVAPSRLSPHARLLLCGGGLLTVGSVVAVGLATSWALVAAEPVPTMGASRAMHLQWQEQRATLAHDAAAVTPPAPTTPTTPAQPAPPAVPAP